MSFRNVKFSLGALLGVFLFSAAANAAPTLTRARCYVPGSAGAMGRSIGERNAARLATNVWLRLGGTCDQVDRFAGLLADLPLARPTQGGEFAACFYMGYLDQIYASLDTQYDRCGTVCFNAGGEIGNMSAQGYCAASLAVGGLLDPGFIPQPPLPFCGASLVVGCKTQYVATATRQYPGCSAYTQGFFAETFDNTVRQDCFVPSDVPIRDRGGRLSADPLRSYLN